LDLTIPKIDVHHLRVQQLANTHPCPQQDKDQGSITDIVEDGEQLFDIHGIHCPGKGIRHLYLDRSLEHLAVNDSFSDQINQERLYVRYPGPDRCRFHPTILLSFHKPFQVLSDDLVKLLLAHLLEETEKELP
jgi:hypothetical protein